MPFSSLNSRYFQTVHKAVSPTNPKQMDQVYRLLGHPMILVSQVDGSPLASLHLECQETTTQLDHLKTRGQALITHRPDQEDLEATENPLQRFQGMIDRDNQEFQFVITNISLEGNINFNIMKTDAKVEMVDPGGLNQVNELRPGESYVVKADQNTGCAMKLSTLKNAFGKATTTVKQDEAREGGPKGTYYYLSVVPQLGVASLEAKFAETKWITSDLLFRPEPYQAPRYARRLETSYLSGSYEYDFGGGGAAGGANSSEDEILDYESEESAGGAGGLWDDDDEDWDVPLVAPAVASAPTPASVPPQVSLTMEGSVGISTVAASLKNASHDLSSAKVKSLASHSFKPHAIFNSKAASVEKGREVQVASFFTGINYNYELNSARCVLGLSVADNLSLEAFEEPDLATEIQELLEAWESGKYLELLKQVTVFETEEDVVTLDGKPDTIFYTCGHCCVTRETAEKLNKCPLCRRWITAKIPRTDSSKKNVSQSPSEAPTVSVSV